MRRRWLTMAAAALVVAGGVFGAWHLLGDPRAHAAPDAPPPAVPVTATHATTRDVPVFLDGIGTVQALSTVAVRPQVGGVLVATPVREGQEVRKGDVIAEIDPRPYQATLDQATAHRAEDAALLQSQQLDLARYRDLARRDFASRQQVDDQQANVNHQIAAIAADDAAIEAARVNLSFCVLRSPVDGRVGLYQTFTGNLVQANPTTPILTVAQDRPITVVMSLPQSSLPRVRAAMARGPVLVQASESDDSRVLATGTLLAPDNGIDTATGTIALKAQFPNADAALWPGQFVNARVQVEVLEHALTIPVVAVEHGPNGEFVYVAGADDTVHPATVQIGYQDDDTAVVRRGLHDGDQIVVSGQSRLAPGVRVSVKPAPDHPPTPTEAADGSASPG